MFCLADGNSLSDSDGEQETVVNQRFSMSPPTSGEVPRILSGNAVTKTANSKFCKKCGQDVTAAGIPTDQPAETVFGFGGMDSKAQPVGFHPPDKTVTFQPPNYATPQNADQSSNSSKLLVVALGVVAGILLSVVVVVLLMGSGDKPPANNNNVKKTNVNNESPTKATLPQTFERNYSGTIGGQPMTMTLKRDGATLKGSVSTKRYDTLEGTIQDDGRFSADGFEDDTQRTGIYSGRINDDGTVSGDWTTTKGTQGRKIYAREQ